jgi:hypothetical protein
MRRRIASKPPPARPEQLEIQDRRQPLIGVEETCLARHCCPVRRSNQGIKSAREPPGFFEVSECLAANPLPRGAEPRDRRGGPPFLQSHAGLRVSHRGEVDRASDAQDGTKQA